MLTAVLAFFVDCILGDPRSRFHPVVLMGNLIAWLEHCFYRPEDTNEKKLLCGGMLSLIVLVVCYEAAWCILRLLGLIPLPHVGMALEALLLAFMISPKSLAAAGMEIRALLKAGDLPEARRKVGWIVGRDTEKLSVPEVSRAAIETVAENTVDGVLAPLFFYLIGGLPLAVLYRAANTMDSMLGYKNAKYLYFGRVAARLDDVSITFPRALRVFFSCSRPFSWASMGVALGACCIAMRRSTQARTGGTPKRLRRVHSAYAWAATTITSASRIFAPIWERRGVKLKPMTYRRPCASCIRSRFFFCS